MIFFVFDFLDIFSVSAIISRRRSVASLKLCIFSSASFNNTRILLVDSFNSSISLFAFRFISAISLFILSRVFSIIESVENNFLNLNKMIIMIKTLIIEKNKAKFTSIFYLFISIILPIPRYDKSFALETCSFS